MSGVDYGKPRERMCPKCDQPWFVVETCTCGARTIPVFAVIPEGERPTTHEPRGNDAVVIVDPDSGSSRMCRSSVRGRLGTGCFAKRYGFLLGDDWLASESRNGLGPKCSSLADAVLWVVEGKRP